MKYQFCLFINSFHETECLQARHAVIDSRGGAAQNYNFRNGKQHRKITLNTLDIRALLVRAALMFLVRA